MSKVALAAAGGKRPYILRKGISRLADLADYVGSPVKDIFVDTKTGSANGDGSSWANPLSLMSDALSIVETGGRVFFRGDVREEITGSNLKFDISIIGVGGRHHADEPSSAYHPG